MLPLTLAKQGEKNTILKIGGNAETKQHLADLGFVTGGSVIVISENNGNLIVNVKETRVAIGRDMAAKIMV
jgi:ferrous iron transport protein A